MNTAQVDQFRDALFVLMEQALTEARDALTEAQDTCGCTEPGCARCQAERTTFAAVMDMLKHWRASEEKSRAATTDLATTSADRDRLSAENARLREALAVTVGWCRCCGGRGTTWKRGADAEMGEREPCPRCGSACALLSAQSTSSVAQRPSPDPIAITREMFECAARAGNTTGWCLVDAWRDRWVKAGGEPLSEQAAIALLGAQDCVFKHDGRDYHVREGTRPPAGAPQ